MVQFFLINSGINRLTLCDFVLIVGNFVGAALGKPQAILSEEALEEKKANITGQAIELSSRGRRSSSSG